MGLSQFEHSTYLLQKQFFKLFGGTFRIYDPTGMLVLFASMKAFKLKEDISIFSDENKTNELLKIKARNIIDISATYDVYDSATDQKIGALRRRGLKSFLKDEWAILDSNDMEIGLIQEDKMILAVLRRLIAYFISASIIPQSFLGTAGAVKLFEFRQHFNLFVQKMNLNFSEDFGNRLDRRLGIAAAVLLCAIEGRQQ